MVYRAGGYRRARMTVKFGLSCPENRSVLNDPSEDRAGCTEKTTLEHGEQLTISEMSQERRNG